MADAATKTDDTPAPGGSDLMSDLNALTKDLATNKRQQIGEETQVADQNVKTLEADRARMKSYLDRDGVGPDDVKKWDADAERQKYSTNPLESFGSLASVFGIMASAFTKAPMENALNASAAAMNATRARDDEAYKRAFEAFKTNMDLVIKRHQMQHEDYQDAMTLMGTDMRIGEAKLKQLAVKYGDRQALLMLDHGMSTELFQMLDSRAKAMQSLVTANEQINKETIQDQVFHSDPRSHSKNADEKYQAFIDSRRMDIKTSVDQQMFDRIWHSEEMSKASPAEKMPLFNKRWGEYTAAKFGGRESAHDRMLDAKAMEIMDQNPGTSFPNARIMAEAQEKAATHVDTRATLSGVQRKTYDDIRAKLHADHKDWDDVRLDKEAAKQTKEAFASPVTGNERVKIESHIQQYGESIQTIDKVIARLHKYVFAAGAPGYATRLGEQISNLFGGNETDRKQMARDIEYLQLNAPRLLLDSNNRPLSSEAGHVRDIIAGLNLGDTTANTIRALQEVKDRYERLREGNRERIGEAPAASSTDAPAQDSAPAAQPWLQAPLRKP